MRASRLRGRGALSNGAGRYEAFCHVDEDDGWYREEEPRSIPTKLLIDSSKSVITYNQSPDVPFDRSINPYRGCEHGCVYCFARPTHAYLGFSAGLDFETRILYKPNAATLLRRELSSFHYQCATIALGVNTDAYQPYEDRLGITRSILAVLAECRHPVSIVTKSALVVRDVDILSEMADNNLVSVHISITTRDAHLKKLLEPRAAAPLKRLKTIETLANAGVPVSVMFAPVIPAINDQELEDIVREAANSGATGAGFVLLRLPHELPMLFGEWLEGHFPKRKKHVLNLIASTRGGSLYDSTFGTRMRGTGAYAEMIGRRFDLACRRFGLDGERRVLCSGLFRRPRADGQMEMFSDV